MGKLRTVLVGSMIGLVLGATMSAAVATTRIGRPDAFQNVAVKDRFFTPARVQIHVGDIVRWKNQGAQTHTTTSDTGLWEQSPRARCHILQDLQSGWGVPLPLQHPHRDDGSHQGRRLTLGICL